MLILASQSPRRRELLENAGVRFRVVAPDVDETPRPKESPRVLVRRLARAKAAAVPAMRESVLAADTVVAVGARILGKPTDDRDAARMLRLLSGRWHEVHTGFCLRSGEEEFARVVTTRVRFRALALADLRRYIATGEGRDKAGAYAIQGIGAHLVSDVRGSYTNVIGLPIAEVLEALAWA
jgi:septum formation protein